MHLYARMDFTLTMVHGSGAGMRVIKSGEKAMDGRKGPSMAFSPLYCVV